MTLINLEELDQVFDTMKALHTQNPEKWREQILEQLSRNDGIDEFRDLAKMKAIIMNFVEEYDISCEETIYQTDKVILNAYQFIQDLVELVGYKKYDEEAAA